MSKDSTELKWRDLALQFDGHRMQAICFLKQILDTLPETEFPEAREFLKAGPIPGEEVLRQRLAEMAAPEMYAELHRLREEIKGPDGFATWKDAAVEEKKKRIELQRVISQFGDDIDYLTAMAAFHSDKWHKMDPITGYMNGWNARGLLAKGM
ncbi:hypothetical protein KXE51_003482 [Salmonella enterica]|nr:hypothetical protein [Salmonella enterica]